MAEIGKYIFEITEKVNLDNDDSLLVGEAQNAGGSAKRHLPKSVATANAITKYTSAGTLKSNDGVDNDDVTTKSQLDSVDNKIDGLANDISVSPVSDSVVRRGSGGTIKAADGVEDDDLITKSQLETDLDPLIKLQPSMIAWNPNDDTYDRVYATTGVTEVHRNMKRCLLLDDGTVNYYLDPNDSTKKLDGTTAVLDGTDGQVMVEIPLFYVRYSEVAAGVKPIQRREVSPVPFSGFVPHPVFCVGGELTNEGNGFWYVKNPTSLRNNVYISAYDACMYDASADTYVSGTNLDDMSPNTDLANDKLSSVSGVYPLVGLTRGEFRTLASNRGTGWCQPTFWLHAAVQWLYAVEYGDFNSQVALARGSVDSSYLSPSNVQTDSPHSIAGKSNIIGNGSGGVDSSTRDTAWMSYRGIENFWGNCWNWVDGVNISDGQYFVANDLSVLADDTQTGYTDLGVIASDSNGYIDDVFADTLSFIPSSSSGSSSSNFADYYYYNSGWRVLSVGGSAGGGSAAGAFCWLGLSSSGVASRGRGGRVAFLG